MPGAGQPVLEAREVTVDLGGARILDDVSLRVEPGELLALVGPNGAGKSTLLAVLAGDITPAAGEVLLDGSPVHATRPLDLARRRAVQVQENRLSFGFTAVDVVVMGRAPWAGTPAEEDDEGAVASAMGRADVTHLADRIFPTLSGGEKARVSFARALAQTTAVVLLDEPTAALDIGHQEAVLTEVRHLVDDGCAVVVVLHDLTLAGAYADRVVLLDDGRLRAEGEPRDVLTADLLSEVYDHPVEVVDHPLSPGPVILPLRNGAGRDPRPTAERADETLRRA